MGILKERHPQLLRGARKFYVCAYNNTYECGVECGGGFKLPEEGGLEFIRIPAGRYAALADGCLGDMHIGGAKIGLWLQNNGVAHENTPVFAVYESLNGKYDNSHIRMKLYKRLK
jgi:DNA gyrase inhibitor GyrI